MQEFLDQYWTQASGAFVLLLVAYLSLLLSWPGFLWLEKITPAQKGTPRANYVLNWKITFSNLLLAPFFVALIVLLTVFVSGLIGLPSLNLSTDWATVGMPAVDVLLQGVVIFFSACFMGDFWYYWWHRAQHTVPFLWEMHKPHHSDENLNATTIYRSHFLEPAGQALFKGLSIGLLFDITAAPESILAAVAGGLLLGLWDYFIHANVRIDALHKLLPFFSIPQFHWIHHSRLPRHQDKNFSIWLPMFDVLFGTYYRPQVDEYPPTGLSSGEKIETVWDTQAGPLITWGRSLVNLLALSRSPDSAPASGKADKSP